MWVVVRVLVLGYHKPTVAAVPNRENWTPRVRSTLVVRKTRFYKIRYILRNQRYMKGASM